MVSTSTSTRNSTSMTARERISKAIIQTMDCLPFYADLLMRSKILPFSDAIRKSYNFSPTICVSIDGNIYYDEEFIQKLSEEEINFIILHEAAHKAYLHLHRIGNRDQRIWNIAADIVVDYDVQYNMANQMPSIRPLKGRIIASRSGTIELPRLGIKVEDVHKKSVEDIYKEIALPLQQQGNQGQGKGDEQNGKGRPDDSLGTPTDQHSYTSEDGTKYEDMTQEQKDALNERAKEEVMEAAVKNKQRGTLPKGVEKMLEQLLRAKINWRQYIYKHIVNELPYDQTLTRPSRRYIAQGMYLPGIVKENVDIVAMIDLSGSITKNEKDKFISWLVQITRQFRNVNITLISHDAKVQAVTEIQMADIKKIIEAKYVGGGGTDHVPCFEWVKEHKRNTPLIVAFTDGYTTFPNKHDVRTPTIWVLSRDGTDEKNIPFGTAIRMDE